MHSHKKTQVIIAKVDSENLNFISWDDYEGNKVPRVFLEGEHPKYGNSKVVRTNQEMGEITRKNSGVFQIDVNVAIEHGIISHLKLAKGTLS